MADRKESAADVRVVLSSGGEIIVERMTATKDIEITTIYGSGRTLPDAYSVDQISYEGTMELQGDKTDLEDDLFDDNGVPVEVTITITHLDDSATAFEQVLATSEGYELDAGETTTTSFDFIAMNKNSDSEPTE
jgi:hypothetical protein